MFTIEPQQLKEKTIEEILITSEHPYNILMSI
jgi:hypothetical protein